VFLSGGIDSTAIAVLAAEARDGDVDTFTVHLAEDAAMDEAPIAERTAKALGTRHHEVTLRERDALDLAKKWLASMDQPSVDGFNTYVISRAARERGIVVALSGLGGDEMFGGYTTFREAPAIASLLRLGRRLPRGLTMGAVQRWPWRSETRAEKARDLLDLDPSVPSVCLWRRRLMTNAQMASLGMRASEHKSFLPPECDPTYGAPSDSDWAAVRALEARLYMGNTLLHDADVFGMAHGLEIRVPLLDRRIVDVALAYARPTWDLRTQPNKPWLVAALAGRIPAELLRRSKSGFTLPIARWMRGPLRDSCESRIGALAKSGLVDGDGAWGVWRQFLRDTSGPSWSRAWMLTTLGEWSQRIRTQSGSGPREQDASACA
jgi:asparagine synthase (glutamine-hydrolysing)